MAANTDLATAPEHPPAQPGMAGKARPRRTQAERRATTRRALLDATLQELDEVGYANLTTASVVARAGVTRGAQAHYFATKADLVVQALRHITDQLIAELIAQPPKRSETVREQYELLLQRLWELNAGIASTALIELWVASRTDPELAEHLDRFQKEISRHLQETAQTVAPEFTALPAAPELLINGLATIRGLWLLRAVTSERRIRRLWSTARDQLVAGAGL
ncbi:MAG TPA: TetR/AcrR family transcriptional regulator [Mycobacteriales bacterium]|nr:TetR/AcrR family transcriptional regulator [Mycobacteriales bacterium]